MTTKELSSEAEEYALLRVQHNAATASCNRIERWSKGKRRFPSGMTTKGLRDDKGGGAFAAE